MKKFFTLALMLTAIASQTSRAYADSLQPSDDRDSPESCKSKGKVYKGFGKCGDIKTKTVLSADGQEMTIEFIE